MASPGGAVTIDGAAGRVAAPFGRRRCEVVENRASGGYRVFAALDRSGPMPRAGQFYMLAAAEGWGSPEGRPFLPRAFSVAEARAEQAGVRLEFLVEDVGPGTARLATLDPGEDLFVTGPLGRPFSAPRELAPGAPGAVLVGGGIGVAPLAILRRELADGGFPVRTLLGFRDREHSGGLDLFQSRREAESNAANQSRRNRASPSAPRQHHEEGVAGQLDRGSSARPGVCCEVRLATEDGHAGHRGYVTELLAVLLEGSDAATAAVYACGPPAMLEAVRLLSAERGVAAELAMETPMACGFGACMGCAVPLAGGGYMRLCLDGPVVRAGLLETAIVEGSGHR